MGAKINPWVERCFSPRLGRLSRGLMRCATLCLCVLLATSALAAGESVIDLWPEGVPDLKPDATPERDDGQGRF